MSSVRAPQPAASARGNVPVAPGPGGSPRSVFTALGIPGLLSILAGLVICGSFLLPWLTATLICTDPLCSTSVIKTLHFPAGSAASPTGFSIASGRFALNTGGPVGNIHESFTFLMLWLVLLAGLLLIALPVLMALGRVDAKRTQVSLLVIGLIALAVEVVYGLSAASALPQTRAGVAALLNGLAVSSGRQAAFTFSTGPGLGFWVAVAATLAAIGISLYGFYGAAASKRFSGSLFWKRVGLSGQIALVAALALVVVFFLPWFATPDPTSPGSAWSQATNGAQVAFLGSVACGLCQAPQINIFPYLWLIPLAALGLVGIVWLLNRGVLWRRLAAILICVTLLVALLVEVSYLLEVQSLHSYAEQIMQTTGQQLSGTTYSVTWGFWVALALTGVALLVSGFLLLGRHKSVTGRLTP
jgi:hypothetical protein